MNNKYVNSILCTLVFLFTTQTAMAQVVAGCTQGLSENERLETARSALRVNARSSSFICTFLVPLFGESSAFSQCFLPN